MTSSRKLQMSSLHTRNLNQCMSSLLQEHHTRFVQSATSLRLGIRHTEGLLNYPLEPINFGYIDFNFETNQEDQDTTATDDDEAYQFHVHRSGNLVEDLATGSGTYRRTATIMGNEV